MGKMFGLARKYIIKTNSLNTVFFNKKCVIKPLTAMEYPKNKTELILTQNCLWGMSCKSRNYCKDACPKPEPIKQAAPPRSDPPRAPALPSKEQLERYFFRTMAFIWDCTNFAYLWTKRNFKIHVAQNPTVRSYMQNLMDRMEKAKRG